MKRGDAGRVSTWGTLVCVVGVALMAAACDSGGDGTLASCASTYGGTISGDIEGDLIARFSPDVGVTNQLEVWIEQTGGGELALVGTVSEEGLLETQGALDLSCQLDLDDCSCTGDWVLDEGLASEKSGTFELEMRQQ